jgi:hypothetical protein
MAREPRRQLLQTGRSSLGDTSDDIEVLVDDITPAATTAEAAQIARGGAMPPEAAFRPFKGASSASQVN